jgi:hypothetical protein
MSVQDDNASVDVVVKPVRGIPAVKHRNFRGFLTCLLGRDAEDGTHTVVEGQNSIRSPGS